MFFQLSPQKADNFPCHDLIDGLWLSHDHGWSVTDRIWSKGYRGNHCAFVEQNDCVVLETDPWRSFPLWYDDVDHCLTNIEPRGRQIWADSEVYMNRTTIGHRYNDIRDLPMHYDTTVDSIVGSLVQNTQSALSDCSGFLQYVFVSGGLDTLCCAALIRDSENVELITHQHFEHDSFTDANLARIQGQFWAYRQIHHWSSPRALITGACGDEYLMRGPRTVAIWTAWHDFDMMKYAQDHPNSYMSAYYLAQKNAMLFEQEWNNRHSLRETYPRYQDLVYHILDILANDHQHWHLGHTLTLTPFRDLNLPLQVLSLPFDTIIEQMLDGYINRQIVRRFWPELECLLSDSKNQDTDRNLQKFADTRLTRKHRSRIL